MTASFLFDEEVAGISVSSENQALLWLATTHTQKFINKGSLNYSIEEEEVIER